MIRLLLPFSEDIVKVVNRVKWCSYCVVIFDFALHVVQVLHYHWHYLLARQVEMINFCTGFLFQFDLPSFAD